MEKAEVTYPPDGTIMRIAERYVAAAACPPLLRLWLDLEAASGRSLTESLASLNEPTSRTRRGFYRLSRLGEWRNGKRQIPPAVAAVLRRMVMPQVLHDIGVAATKRQIDRLCAAVSDVC